MVDDEIITLQKAVTISVSDDDLLTYRLSLVDAGDRATELRTLKVGSVSVSNYSAGVIDATNLVNGIVILRLRATDVAGNVATLDVPVRIDGGAKVGAVQLSFVDMSIPAPGFDVQVVRSYDSRRASEAGDFGYGWQLELHGPQVRNNRPVGQYNALWTDDGSFTLPCREQGHVRSHFTEVRISESEYYVFTPFVANPQAVSGTCIGDIAFDQLDGSAIGATLAVVGDTQVYPSTQLRISASSPPPMDLLDMNTGEVYDAEHYQLTTPDGRVFDISTRTGLNWVQDTNGNTLFVSADSISSNRGQGLSVVRDLKDRITKVVASDGSTVGYGYDLAGDLRAVTSAGGYRTRFEYSDSDPHHLSKVTDPEGVEQALFTYDADGRLRQSCGAENHCVEIQRDLAQRQEWFIDGEEEERTTYDARGNVIIKANALNETWTYTYDAQDRMLTSTSPLGEVTSYTYDANGNLLSEVKPHEQGEDPADFTTAHTYGAFDRRESTTFPSGGSLHWEHDERGNEVALRDGSLNVIWSRVVDTNGHVIQETNRFGTWHHSYKFGDTVWNEPRTTIDPFGHVITFTRDIKGRAAVEDHGDLVVRRSFDRDDRLTQVNYGFGLTVTYEYEGARKYWKAISGPSFGRVAREFWADGKLSRITEPNGDTREFYYDANRRLLRQVDELENVTEFERDAAGRVIETRELATGAVTKTAYDAAGNVLRRTDALNHETEMSYRAGGRMASITDARDHTRTFYDEPTARSVTDALSRTTTRHLNAYGLTLSTSYPGGTSSSSTYRGQTRADESQRFPLTAVDEGARTRGYGYDAHSGLISATDLGGANAWQYTYERTRAGAQISWDAESGTVELAPVDARASAYGFSAGEESTGDLDGAVTHELKSVISPLGSTTTFARDVYGRPTQVTLPWGASKTYGYSGADALPEVVTLPQGTALTFSYDDAKREIGRTTSFGESRNFVYGPGNRLESMTDATGTTMYEYDEAGRFAGIVYPHGGSVRYQRDKLGRTIRQETCPSAFAQPLVTEYAYDAVGNLSGVVDPLGGETTFEYDAENRLVRRELPNGVVTTYTYDARDRPLSVVHTNVSGVVLASRVYVRAPGGEPTKITKQDGSWVAIGYDSALRITSEKYYEADGDLEEEIGYTYDADGNRLSKTVDGAVMQYRYASGARLVEVEKPGGVIERRVTDDGGRETALAVMSRQLALTYDSDDHVIHVGDSTLETATYFAFDAAGRRVGVMDQEGEKRFLTAPNLGDGYESPQAVTDDSGTVLTSFVFAGEHPLMKLTANGPEYYLADGMGSVLAIADAAGAGLESFEYDGFGNARGAEPELADDTHGDFRFQGMWKDPSGLYYVRARVYDAGSGRFTSRDPNVGDLFVPETLEPYVFAQGNPLLWSDPSGRITLSDLGASIQAFVSGLLTRAASFALYIRTAREASNGLRLLHAARTLASVTVVGAKAKAEILVDFMRRIGFTIQGGLAKGLRDAGPYLEMISDDGRYAFRIIKETGTVLYGKMDLQKAEYIWRQL